MKKGIRMTLLVLIFAVTIAMLLLFAKRPGKPVTIVGNADVKPIDIETIDIQNANVKNLDVTHADTTNKIEFEEKYAHLIAESKALAIESIQKTVCTTW